MSSIVVVGANWGGDEAKAASLTFWQSKLLRAFVSKVVTTRVTPWLTT